MRLNTIQPAPHSRKKPKRLGRGIGSTDGKTSGKGHKGQHARAGGYHKLGFEGGQTPLYRRLPKLGFKSRVAKYTLEIPVGALNNFTDEIINFTTLKSNNFISANTKKVKIILSGKIEKPIIVSAEILLTKGAKEAIIAAGGKVESE